MRGPRLALRLQASGNRISALNKRTRSLGTENAFVVLAEVSALARQGKDIISLRIGQPDFLAPENMQGTGIRVYCQMAAHGATSAPFERRCAVAVLWTG